MMQTVVETPAYLSAAKDAGVSEDERTAIVDMLAAEPMAGDVMPGCGGARKMRVAGKGKGKSGGYRLITYFGGDDIPVFLITIFAKGEKVNLTKAERNMLAERVKLLPQTLVRKDM
jgi:hypothetical protein